MSEDITSEGTGIALLLIVGYLILRLMKLAFWDSIIAGRSASNPNVKDRDQHRKKNCAVESCNAVVSRMTDFCHKHQNETPTPPNTIESKDTSSQSETWFKPTLSALFEWIQFAWDLFIALANAEINSNYNPRGSDSSENDNSNFYKSGTVYACINGHQINSYLITSKCPFCGKPMSPKY